VFIRLVLKLYFLNIIHSPLPSSLPIRNEKPMMMAREAGGKFSGGPGRNRTCDIRLRRPLFCPLNYGTKAGVEGVEPTMRDSKSRALPLGDTPKKEPAPMSITLVLGGRTAGLEHGCRFHRKGRGCKAHIPSTTIILPCLVIATLTGPPDTTSSLHGWSRDPWNAALVSRG